MDKNLHKLWETVKDRGAWDAEVRGVTKSWIETHRKPPELSVVLFAVVPE